ncbi:MAG: transglycosylase SLT domain-containing protein, partial [Bdellovibrionaceae bacterium]|nr:transglycosylase SLT domain-containing protein [Pseudobdellovibrionaceae bacterium]
RRGPWKASLVDLWSTAGIELAKTRTKSPEALRKTLQALLAESDLLNKEKQATALALLGESYQKSDPAQTLFLWKQAEALFTVPELAAKMEQLEAAQSSKVKPAPTEALKFEELVVDGAESETDAQITKLLSENKRVNAAEKMVELLNRFPNGQWARRDRDRLPQMLYAAVDRGDESEAQKLRNVMLDADPSRLQDWIPGLHRRGEDKGVVIFAEKALQTQSSSPAAAAILWSAGRSAHFIGETEKAKRFYDRLIQFHAQTDEASEAMFRLGLLQLREGLFATAAKTFEKLIVKNVPRWDLNARYWRIRGLEKVDVPRAELEKAELLRLYPFTYYGLRLRGEMNQGQVEFPKNDRSPMETLNPITWLVGEQRKTWKRFLKLSEEGWLLEAQAELSEIPTPRDPWSLLQWAKTLAKTGQHPASILLSARAIDQEESLRHPRYLDFAFPKTYSRFIESESKKNQIEPVLVRSLIRQESAFGLKAVSTSNALGLMQLIPPTAKEVAQELKLSVTIPDDLFRPEINVPMGSYYIAKMLRQYNGQVPLALAAYNAGPTRMNRWIRARPETDQLRAKTFDSWTDEIWYDELPWSETSFYVKAILRNVLMDRLTAEGRVAVSPGFWSDLHLETARIAPEAAKQR